MKNDDLDDVVLGVMVVLVMASIWITFILSAILGE